jgi:hypothetical protein
MLALLHMCKLAASKQVRLGEALHQRMALTGHQVLLALSKGYLVGWGHTAGAAVIMKIFTW